MTTTTRDKIVCKCGHSGSLVRVESDYAFKSGWSDEYYLDGFYGGRLIVRNDEPAPVNVLAALNIQCTKCKRRGMVGYA